MIKFNDNNIIVGYINQLLATYNLPTFKIYKDKIFKGVNYLYNGKIMRADKTETKTDKITESDFKFVCYYSEDFRRLVYYKDNNKLINYNLVDHLPIDNLTYNTDTHVYLGNFLRFISDYEGINLLSLYNCFSNEMPKNLNIKISETTVFNSEDNNYKIYSIPVKFFKNYTIAIESDTPVEITCGFYNNNINYNVGNEELNEITYQKFSNMRFNQPVLYSKINNISITEKEMTAEKDLKMFIKLASSTNSSIVVLEGDYRDKSNSILLDPNTSTKGLISNITKHNDSNIMISKSQLLAINSGISYPFADRLIEYLVRNVVTNKDDVTDNIRRFQQYLFKYKDIVIKNYGIWDNNYSKIIENIAIENNMNDYDLLFYIDKDIESKINLDIDIYGGNK